MAAIASFATQIASDNEDYNEVGCIFCGSATNADKIYCSSICELQDSQTSSDQLSTVPALSSRGGSTGSASSVASSSPPSSPEKSPNFALSSIDDLTANISNFNLPPSMVQSKITPTRTLNYNYSYPHAKATEVLLDPISPPSPILLGHLHAKPMGKSKSNSGRTSIPSESTSPTTPTAHTVLRLQRNPAQVPSAPRRESRGLLSPQLRPIDAAQFSKKPSSSKPSPSNLSLSLPKACLKPGCPSLHHTSRVSMPKFENRRPSAPLTPTRTSMETDEDADNEASTSALYIRGRKTSHKKVVSPLLPQASTSVVDGTKGKRSESAHAIGSGVCERFRPDLVQMRGRKLEKMTPLDLNESAIRTSSSESDEEDQGRGRRGKAEVLVNERGRSKKREGTLAVDRRSRSRHREFSR